MIDQLNEQEQAPEVNEQEKDTAINNENNVMSNKEADEKEDKSDTSSDEINLIISSTKLIIEKVKN